MLLLRSTDKTKDSFTIVIRTPGGEVSYDVPAMKVKDYSLEDIFERKLYCLIPFYIFTYEDRFKEINNDSAKTEALANVSKEIMEILDQLTLDGVINTFYKVSIIDMSRRVLYNLTKNYEDLRKGVIEVMGGQVLDYEAKRIYHEGMEEGREEGREEGSINTLVSLVKKGIITLHSATAEAGISEDDFSKKMKSV